MQFNELKATVTDYIWLIRDSLSANNAIYFQFTFFFSVKPCIFPQMMKDSSQQLVCPFRYLWYADFFHGVDNELQLASPSFPTLPYSLRVNYILVLGSCRFAAVGIQPAQSHSVPWEQHPPPTRALVRAPAANPAPCQGVGGGTDPFPGQEVPSGTQVG